VTNTGKQEVETTTTAWKEYMLSHNPHLNQYVGYDKWTNIYDRYRCNKVVYKFWWGKTMFDQAYAGAKPVIWTCYDYDDATLPTDVMTVAKYANSKRHIATTFSCVWKPAITVDTGVLNMPKWKQWIDCTKPAIEQHGLKMGIEVPGMTKNTLNWQAYGYFSFAGRRT
jgi:hypothetical protein